MWFQQVGVTVRNSFNDLGDLFPNVWCLSGEIYGDLRDHTMASFFEISVRKSVHKSPSKSITAKEADD